MAILKIESKNAGSGCYAEVFVARYEVYPNVDPTGVCVGFTHCLQSKRSFWILGHCCP